LFLGWLQCDQHEIIQYLREENRVPKAQLRTSRIRLTNGQRRRLAGLGAPLGRRLLTRIATIVTADTILRWHRQLIAKSGRIRPAVLAAERTTGDLSTRGADGDRESQLGLHAASGRLEESG
jgi:hypothetical protein